MIVLICGIIRSVSYPSNEVDVSTWTMLGPSVDPVASCEFTSVKMESVTWQKAACAKERAAFIASHSSSERVLSPT